MMIDNLKDLLEHTYSLGCIDLVKITGTAETTVVAGLADDRSVVVDVKFHNPIAEFIGTFGMPNMATLKTILSIDEYKDNATITVKQDPTRGPVSVNFKNEAGDFTNDYRFMTKEIVDDMLKEVKFKGVNWDVELEPSVASTQRLKFQAMANSAESTFVAKTEDGDLKFYFGDHSSHAGNFVFAHDVVGELKRNWHWPIAHVINILNLPGDKVLRISDGGAAQIVVDSGIAEYTYTLPAQSK
jgi:hypothetical protein